MDRDVMADEGLVMLGSRLKRLAERLQAGAELIARDSDLPVKPGQMALLTALHRSGAMSVGDLAEALGLSQPAISRSAAQLAGLGLISARRVTADLRSKVLALTDQGTQMMDHALIVMWPRLRAAVAELGDGDALLRQLAGIEASLAARPLHQRPGPGLSIRRFGPERASDFKAINLEWIHDMFVLEQTDRDVLDAPYDRLIAPGGDVLFVEDPALGIIGTCGLRKTGPGDFELTKMGVLKSARGRGAGEFLLTAMIARAGALGAKRLYLLSNARNAAAVRLYEKHGFVHDGDIMAEFGSSYERCDVAMIYKA